MGYADYCSAERFELECEENAYHDYHSELWASERESMKLEGYYAEGEDLDRALKEGDITKACHTIQFRRLQEKYHVGPFAPDTRTDEQRNDEAVDALFAPGGKFHYFMRNEDNGPEG